MTLTIFRPEAFAKPPDAVMFDTDNTLYPYDPAHRAAMRAVRDKSARLFAIDEERFDHAFGTARSVIKQRLGNTASSHSRLLYFQQMLEIIGLGSQVLLALDLEQTYWRTFLSNAHLFDGVKDFLDDLRIAGIPTAVVTDLTSQIQFRKIVYFELDRYFDHIVTSEEAGFDKPHAAPFEIAVAKLQPAGTCLWMIGDSAHCDVAGARTAISAVTIQKLHEGVERGKGACKPDATVHDFESLRVLFEKIRQASK